MTSGPWYAPSFTKRSGLCGLWSTLTPVIFATARIGQRVRLLVKAIDIMLCLPFRPAAGDIFSRLLFRHREPQF